MSNQDRPLGGRLPLLQPDAMSYEQRQVYDRIKARVVPWADGAGFTSMAENGALIGPFNSQLLSPEIDARYLGLVEAEQAHSSLGKRVREVVILAVGAVWKADYELYAHQAAGKQLGLSEAALRAAASGQLSDDLDEQEAIAYRFARQISLERHVDDDLYVDAEQAFGQRGLADVMYLIGIYQLVCGFLSAFEVPAPKD